MRNEGLIIPRCAFLFVLLLDNFHFTVNPSFDDVAYFHK